MRTKKGKKAHTWVDQTENVAALLGRVGLTGNDQQANERVWSVLLSINDLVLALITLNGFHSYIWCVCVFAFFCVIQVFANK